jgi:hypothetical protein
MAEIILVVVQSGAVPLVGEAAALTRECAGLRMISGKTDTGEKVCRVSANPNLRLVGFVYGFFCALLAAWINEM